MKIILTGLIFILLTGCGTESSNIKIKQYCFDKGFIGATIKTFGGHDCYFYPKGRVRISVSVEYLKYLDSKGE